MAPPSKLTQEMSARAEEYLTDFGYDGDVIPSVEGLSFYLKVSRKTIYNWRDKEIQQGLEGDDCKILHTLDAIESKQKSLALNKGISGDFNATISKLILANHGMHDKQDSTHSGPNGGPIQVTQPVTFTDAE